MDNTNLPMAAAAPTTDNEYDDDDDTPRYDHPLIDDDEEIVISMNEHNTYLIRNYVNEVDFETYFT